MILEAVRPDTGEPIGLRLQVESCLTPRMILLRERLAWDFAAKTSRMHPRMKRRALERLKLDFVIAAVTGWEWASGVHFHGARLECTPANVRMLFAQLPFLQEQVDLASGDLETVSRAGRSDTRALPSGSSPQDSAL